MATAAALPSQIEAPTAHDDAWEVLDDSDPDYLELGGMYGPSPNYQSGTIPYTEYGDGGGFVLGADGAAQVQNEFDLRFSLSVPRAESCPMPAGGYPIVLYAHGTGGNYRSYAHDGTGKVFNRVRIFCVGYETIDHVALRPGRPANRTVIQAAADGKIY